MNPEDIDPQSLPEGLSHILVEIPYGGLKFDPKAYLEAKGVAVESRKIITDDNGNRWLIVSVNMVDIRKLILELYEKGLSGNIRGINLKL
jgi:hypothetical protein